MAKLKASVKQVTKLNSSATCKLRKENVPLPTNVAKNSSYASIVKRIAKEYGVKVGPVPKPRENPYTLDPADADRVLKKAGILTATGKLKSIFR